MNDIGEGARYELSSLREICLGGSVSYEKRMVVM